MRKLTRVRTSDIPAAFTGEGRIDQILKLLKKEREIIINSTGKHKFPSTWSPCKKQLHIESHEKCAYCESPTTVISYGDVEHYRPKSKYWWLAYCYDNYLASCTLCNQKYKKAKFDVDKQTMPSPKVKANNTDAQLKAMAKTIVPDPLNESEALSYKKYLNAHKAERPLLVNPYMDDPIDYFAWKVDHTDAYIKLIPIDSSNNLNVRMVKAAENDYGINRKTLCRHRYDTYLIYCGARLTSENKQVPSTLRQYHKGVWGKSD